MARCPPAFSGAADRHLGEPAPYQLLDRRDVDRPIVEVVLDGRHLGGEKAPVGPDRVPGQRDRAGLGHMGPDELERGVRRLLEGDRRGLYGRQQAALRVHLPHDVSHSRQLFGRGRHHKVGALGHHLQVVIGDQGGDLDDDIACRRRARSSRDPSIPARPGHATGRPVGRGQIGRKRVGLSSDDRQARLGRHRPEGN